MKVAAPQPPHFNGIAAKAGGTRSLRKFIELGIVHAETTFVIFRGDEWIFSFKQRSFLPAHPI